VLLRPDCWEAGLDMMGKKADEGKEGLWREHLPQAARAGCQEGPRFGETLVAAVLSSSCVALQRIQRLQLLRRIAARAWCCRRNMCVATHSHISL